MTALDTRRVKPRSEAAPDRRLSWRLAALVGALVLLLMTLAAVVQPAMDADVAPTGLELFVMTLFDISLFATIAGLGMRRRWGLGATAVLGGVMIGASVMCVTAGHTGAWIAVQGLAGLGIFSGAGVAARLT